MNSMTETIVEVTENIKEAYLAAKQRAATLPEYTNIANLAETILSIPDPQFSRYKLQQIINGNLCDLIITEDGEGEDVLIGQTIVDGAQQLYIVQV